MMVLDEKFQSYYNSSKMSEPNLMAKLIETGGGNRNVNLVVPLQKMSGLSKSL